jgi:sulfur carrier protein ThiS
LEVDPAACATVGDLLHSLGYTPEEQRSLSVLADGARLGAGAPLDDVQLIEILVAIGGG